jgi:hypothetical protein
MLTDQGLIATIRGGKKDQEKQGRQVLVAFGVRPETRPVRGHFLWLNAMGIVKGPVFRTVDRHGCVSGRHRCGEGEEHRWS